MSLAGKLNSNRNTVREDINTKEIEYVSAVDLLKEVKPKFPVKIVGFFIKNGDYGEQVTIIVELKDGEVLGVNIPKRYAEMFKNFSDDEVEDIKAGALGIQAITPDLKTPKGKTTGIEFCDM